MKAVLSATGVLGLAAVFGLFEPTPASGKPVTSNDVRLVSEQMSGQSSSELASRYRNGKGRGLRGYHAIHHFLDQDGDSW